MSQANSQKSGADFYRIVGSTNETEAADAIARRDDLLIAVCYYADNPMTGTSLQLICDDIRRELKRTSSTPPNQE
jgi:hypothetical protein